jgi:CDP-glucose 4,6-dehydratase
MSFWAGKKVFITGHTGFKGGWLSIWLQKLGAEITGFSLPASNQSLFRIARVAEGMTTLTGDIRDLADLQNAIVSCRPDIIIHMAAQALVRPSYDDPVDTFSTNVMGTVNLLEAVRHAGSVKVVINVTSDKCYENSELLKRYRESDPMGGYDPYSCSKGCAELVTSAFRRSFLQEQGVALASVRAGNVLGGGDWGRDRLVPDIIQSLLSNTSVLIRNPAAIRPWQHVCEPLRGYLMLAEKLWHEGDSSGGAWNFGPAEEDSRPVSWIADYMCTRWGSGADWYHDEADQPHEAAYLKLDCSKARDTLFWLPKMDLPTALDWTIEWYQAYADGNNMRDMTEKQIDMYLERCSDE